MIAGSDLVRGLRSREARRPARARMPQNRRDSVTVRQICVAVICTATLGLAVIAQFASSTQSGSAAQLANQSRIGTDAAASSPKIRKVQVLAWFKEGGTDLFDSYDHLIKDAGQLFSGAVDASLKKEDKRVGELRSRCVDLARWSTRANAYFRFPDPRQRSVWLRVVDQTKEASADCQSALDQRSAALLVISANKLIAAIEHATQLNQVVANQIRGLR